MKFLWETTKAVLVSVELAILSLLWCNGYWAWLDFSFINKFMSKQPELIKYAFPVVFFGPMIKLTHSLLYPQEQKYKYVNYQNRTDIVAGLTAGFIWLAISTLLTLMAYSDFLSSSMAGSLLLGSILVSILVTLSTWGFAVKVRDELIKTDNPDTSP